MCSIFFRLRGMNAMVNILDNTAVYCLSQILMTLISKYWARIISQHADINNWHLQVWAKPLAQGSLKAPSAISYQINFTIFISSL